MKRILVTGGAGFIGTNLCKALLNRGDQVICLDNLFSSSKEKIIPFLKNPNFEFVRHDITEPYRAEVDEIYNLACPASPPYYQHDAIQTIKTSVIGAINVLELAKQTGATILQASTSEVYGDPEMHPQPESYWGHVNPIGVRSCYDEGKRCAESLFINYHLQNQVDIKIIRIFNTYGPYMEPDDGRVISNFIIQALKGNTITIYGDGQQTRSFQFIDDLVNAMTLMMDSRIGFTGPVNIGNPNYFTMLELAELIIELTNSKSKIEHFPLPKDDPIHRQPDIALARKELKGWEPREQLREGLKRTISYFVSKLL